MLSKLFELGVRLRHVLYDRGLFRQERVDVPVVSVGNIVCGGVGKTPLVQMLVRELAQKRRVAILTRGYRSEAEKVRGGLRISSEELPDPRVCGDEPYLLARSLPGVPLYVGRDRVASARRAIAEGAEMLVLDDGMQHRRLCRDVECVVLDGRDLFGRGSFLPRGRLRDVPERLSGATVLFVNHVQTAEAFEAAKRELRQYSEAPVIGVGYQVEAREREPVGLFCALGSPERFVETAEAAGCEVVARQFALDHRPFDLKQLKSFSSRASALGAVRLVCTEKDWVKLPKLEGLELPVEVIKGELEIRFGKEHFNELLKRVGV